MNDKKLVVLTGPTAVGKTALSIKLAQAIGGEIISADSMQVYRGMDIGSAKIRPEEMQGIPHYLIDILDPADSFDIVQIVNKLKDTFDIKITPVDINPVNFNSAENLWAMVQKLQ